MQNSYQETQPPTSARARCRSTPERGARGRMRGKLAQPDRGNRRRCDQLGVDRRSRRHNQRSVDHQQQGRDSLGPSSASNGSGALAFAGCMRANGVPNFPDPQPGGGQLFQIPAGANPDAPAFTAARAKCQHLLNAGGTGSGPPPSDQTLAKLVRIARCMCQHGISDFPDPRTSAPASIPPGIAQEINFDGAILLLPLTLNLQAPAYRQALTACGAPPLGFQH